MEFGAYGGAGAVRSGGGTALDAADAAPVFRMRWRPLKVLRRRPWLRRGREGLVGLSTVKNGAGTGTAVREPGPARPSTRRWTWMWSGALACCRPVHDVDCGA